MSLRNMQKKGLKIGIIGYGNMGSAIGNSLSDNLDAEIVAYDTYFKNQDGGKIRNAGSISHLVAMSKFIILSVKPQDFPSLAEQLRQEKLVDKVFISIIAGVPIKKISALLKSKNIVRTMPNLPLREGKGVTGWFASKILSAVEKKQVEKIISCWGMQFKLRNESLINAITAISGSGPAYFFLFCELLAKAAKNLGLPEAIVEDLSRQTMIGSAALLESSPMKVSEFREAITSKKGTTEAALKSFKKSGLGRVVNAAVKKAAARAVELSK